MHVAGGPNVSEHVALCYLFRCVKGNLSALYSQLEYCVSRMSFEAGFCPVVFIYLLISAMDILIY